MTTLEKLKELLAEQLEIDVAEVNEASTFEDLDIDSLDAVELLMNVEEEFDIEINYEELGTSVGDLVSYIDERK